MSGAGLVAVLSSLVHLCILRPQILSELFFAALLLPLSRPLLSWRAVVCIPLVFAVWANCHGAFPVGFVLIGAFLGGQLLTAALRARSVSEGPRQVPRLRFGLVGVWRDTQARRLALALALSVAAIQKGQIKPMRRCLLTTIFFGLIFLGCQVYEFAHFVHEKDLTLSSSVFGSTFYVLTGTHGTHVAIGVF